MKPWWWGSDTRSEVIISKTRPIESYTITSLRHREALKATDYFDMDTSDVWFLFNDRLGHAEGAD